MLDNYMPPVSGALRWTHNLYERIKVPLQNFNALQHPLVFYNKRTVESALSNTNYYMFFIFSYFIFSFSYSITESDEAKAIVKNIEQLMKRLKKFDEDLFKEWAASISKQIENNLQQCLLKINSKTKELYLNFNPEVC